MNKESYLNKEFLIMGNTDRIVKVIDIDDAYMTVEVIKNRYGRINCVGDFFPYVGDIVKYPLTDLPILYIDNRDLAENHNRKN